MNVVYFNAEKFYRLAYDYLNYENNLKQAEKYINLALKDDRRHFKSIILKGKIFLAKNNIKGALKLFFKAYKMNPEDFSCLFSLAKAYNFENKNKIALEFLEKISPEKISDGDFLTEYYDLKINILETINQYKRVYRNSEQRVYYMNF